MVWLARKHSYASVCFYLCPHNLAASIIFEVGDHYLLHKNSLAWKQSFEHLVIYKLKMFMMSLCQQGKESHRTAYKVFVYTESFSELSGSMWRMTPANHPSGTTFHRNSGNMPVRRLTKIPWRRICNSLKTMRYCLAVFTTIRYFLDTNRLLHSLYIWALRMG